MSQYDATPMYINPAMTGMYDGDYKAYLNYRNQWSAVGTKPWTTYAIGYDRPYKRYGMGAFIMNNQAGVGGFNILNFVLSGAYEITDDPKMYNHLSVGLQLGFIHKYFDPDKYLYNNQYTVEGGGKFDKTLPIGEVFENTTVFLPESNLGVYYSNSNPDQKYNPFGGISLFHLTSPKESFLSTEDNQLPRRIVVHGGMNYRMDEVITITPTILFMRQKNVNEINFGALMYYNWSKRNDQEVLEGAETILIFGPSYRNKDAVVIHVGMIHMGITYRISYDINTSSLSSVSNYRGGFELSVVYKSPKTSRHASMFID